MDGVISCFLWKLQSLVVLKDEDNKCNGLYENYFTAFGGNEMLKNVEAKKEEQNAVMNFPKKYWRIFGCTLFALVAFPPFGAFLAFCFGYQMELVSVSAFVIVTAFLSVCLSVWSMKAGGAAAEGVMNVLFALLSPVSLVNAVFCMIECSEIWVTVGVIICIVCCLVLTVKHGKPLALKMIALVLSGLMILPVGFFGFMLLTFGNIGHNTVVKSVESPNGVYYAKVIDSDQGALGGDTLVDVYENKEINVLVFKLYKMPQRVYYGDWGEFENMEIHWKDDHCLVINSVEYDIESNFMS